MCYCHDQLGFAFVCPCAGALLPPPLPPQLRKHKQMFHTSAEDLELMLVSNAGVGH